MIKRRNWWLSLLAAAVMAGPVRADFALTDGDRVLVAGDTPIWPASVGLQLETFVRVKYPELKTRFWHFGAPLPQTLDEVAGELVEHVKAFKPTKVILNFGLYEGQSKAFDPARLQAFRTALAAMVDRCRQDGAEVVLLAPNCPEVQRKVFLAKASYDDAVGRYVAAIREFGQQRELKVIDWFARTEGEARATPAGAPDQTSITSDGLRPTPRACGTAAQMLLEAWGATPHEVTVHLDWKTLEASTSSGSVAAVRQSEAVVLLKLTNFPVPWVLPSQRGPTPRRWQDAGFCRFVFHVHHAPGGGILTSLPGGRPTPWLDTMLERGFDMSTVGPLLRVETVRDLMNLHWKKNMGQNRFASLVRKPLPGPEYEEANDHYRAAMVAEAEGTSKVIDRTPRTMDLTLEIRLARPPAPQN